MPLSSGEVGITEGFLGEGIYSNSEVSYQIAMTWNLQELGAHHQLYQNTARGAGLLKVTAPTGHLGFQLAPEAVPYDHREGSLKATHIDGFGADCTSHF